MGVIEVIVIKSPAKLNLFLNIINKRNDGYHNIETYFQFVSLYDEISLNLIPGNKIDFRCNNKTLSNSKNLCVKAAELLKKNIKLKKNLNASIFLKKNIPVGGGLGGGSSNAAMVLMGLNQLWGSYFTKNELIEMGKELGSDVPVFISGFSAYGKETGTLLTAHELDRKFFLIIYPKIHVSSKAMYCKYEIKDCIKSINLDNMHHNIGFNSFENLLCSEFSEIKSLLELLRKNGNGAVSGSGSCLFSIFDNEDSAQKFSKLIPEKYETYVVHSLNRI
jgi:4-diphosphocytidyl-2-C-methyl-D-erythritol kinase